MIFADFEGTDSGKKARGWTIGCLGRGETRVRRDMDPVGTSSADDVALHSGDIGWPRSPADLPQYRGYQFGTPMHADERVVVRRRTLRLMLPSYD